MLLRRYHKKAEEPAETTAVDPADLKGKALDEALTAAGLPTSGKADEKRARLAEHLAAGDESEPETPDEGAQNPDAEQAQDN